jgi:hypothetical protein
VAIHNTQIARSMMDMPGSLGGMSEWLAKMLPTGGLPAVEVMKFKALKGPWSWLGSAAVAIS